MGASRRPTGQVLNILRVYHQATVEEMQGGMRWYRDMIDLAEKRVKAVNRKYKCGYKLDRDMIAGILAALSPQKAWATNIKLSEQVVRGDRVGTFSKQVIKARRILAGEKPLDVLRGLKETAFYRCFVDCETEAVTVDGHAYTIWMGTYESTNKVTVPPRIYRLASIDYRKAAELEGVRPHQMQAVTWLTWRRLNGSRGHTIDKNNGL
jgi:hypothetical protein